MTVPTVERGFFEVVFCSIEMAGDRPVDMVDVRLLHHVEELPRIGRQRLDIAPLALGIDGVEGERGLAGAREPGDHHELLARQIERDILEIVLARAADGDEFGGHADCNVGAGAGLDKGRKGLVPNRLAGKGKGLGREDNVAQISASFLSRDLMAPGFRPSRAAIAATVSP